MNRRAFFQHMMGGLLETIKEVAQPFMEEEVEKIDRAVDTVLMMKWVQLPSSVPPDFRGWQDIYLGSTWVYLHADGQEWSAYNKICTHCQAITTRLDAQKVIKCMICEKTFSMEQQSGELALERYPVKRIDGQYCIGLPQLLRKQGDLHA